MFPPQKNKYNRFSYQVKSIHNPLQDAFVKLVEIRQERKEQVQYKCWAGWASEDKMRDTLKIKEWDPYNQYKAVGP